MAANFWIAIPINDFFHYSSEVMKKYGVSAYIELIGEIPGKRRIYTYDENNPEAFIKYFSDPDYYRFYFSSYPFQNLGEVCKFGTFYSPEIEPFTIEGNGGVEHEKTCEQIYLRQILKQPDKNIQRFYLALQRKLKNISGIQNSYVMGRHEYKNRYCLPTSKIIIPHNSHSNKVKGSWEEFYLSLLEKSNENKE